MFERTLRPSPGAVVAVLALVLALGGTAIAGSGGSAPHLTKANVKKIAKRQIMKAAPKLSVAKAATADHASTADTATTATRANHAATAGDAQTVNGQTIVPIHFSSDVGTDVVLAQLNGLTLRVSCTGDDETITATSSTAGTELTSVSTDLGDSLIYHVNDDFGPEDGAEEIGPKGSSTTDRQYMVTFVAPDGEDVVATFVTEDSLGTNDCVVGGQAIG